MTSTLRLMGAIFAIVLVSATSAACGSDDSPGISPDASIDDARTPPADAAHDGPSPETDGALADAHGDADPSLIDDAHTAPDADGPVAHRSDASKSVAPSAASTNE